MKELNKLRLLAGVQIDPSIEVTEKQVTESVQLNEAATGALDDFFVVGHAGANYELNDVIHRTNSQGLIRQILGIRMGKNFQEELKNLLIFSGDDEATATKVARKRLRDAQKAKEEAEEEMFFQKAELEYEEEMEYEEATKLADEDFDGDGKVETPEEEFKGSRDKAIKKSKKDKVMEMEGKCGGKHSENEEKSEKSKKKDDCCDDEKCTDGSKCKEDVKESMHTYQDKNYDSWEDDKDDPVNVSSKKNEPKSHDLPAGDKDESPNQLDALDVPSQQDQTVGDHDQKINVPADIKKQLKDQADEARKEAEKLNVSNRDASYFYKDLARAFDDLRGHLEGGTVYDMKQAQIFMTSLMGPMLHKIPADVVRFISYGGKSRSLKDYMNKVDSKYPITGPRNALDS